MKPTALQDAIKAMAAAKESRRANGEWKEPVVKRHTMTAQEYQTMKGGSTGSNSTTTRTARSPPSGSSSHPHHPHHHDSGNSYPNNSASVDEMKTLLQQMIDERAYMTREKDQCLRQMKDMKSEMKLYMEGASLAANEAKEAAVNHSSSSTSSVASTSTPTQASIASMVEDAVRRYMQEHQNHEIQTLREQVNVMNTGLKDIRGVVDNLQKTITEMTKVHKVLQLAHDTMQTEHASTITKLSKIEKEMKKIHEKEEISRINRNVFDHFDTDHTDHTTSPKSPSKDKSFSSPVTPNQRNVSSSSPQRLPSSGKKPMPSLDLSKPSTVPDDTRSRSLSRNRSQSSGTSSSMMSPTSPPYTSEELYEAQRKDTDLREYMKSNSKSGLPYTAKQTSIEILEGYKLLYFRKRVYIPATLRKATIQFYVATYGDNESLANLSKYCIWPDLEADYHDFVKKHPAKK
jgi:hypothetical protein